MAIVNIMTNRSNNLTNTHTITLNGGTSSTCFRTWRSPTAGTAPPTACTLRPAPRRLWPRHHRGFLRHGAGGSDVVDMKGFGLTFGALRRLMSPSSADVKITINALTVLTIQNVTTAQLAANDVLL